nr:thermonuclease family protein [Plastoroseomonas hellenica]
MTLPRRRIFKPARTSRRIGGGVLAVLGLAGLGSLLVAVGLPTNLFGSAPRESEWRAEAHEVRIVDGETLRLGDRILRLSGVEAPQRGQACRDARGGGFDCGDAAADALARLIGGHGLTCRMQGRDSYGRGLGVCTAAETELNAALVGSGWAMATGRDRLDLRPQQAEARRQSRGFWAAAAAPPGWQ